MKYTNNSVQNRKLVFHGAIALQTQVAYEFWLLKQYSSKTRHHMTETNFMTIFTTNFKWIAWLLSVSQDC